MDSKVHYKIDSGMNSKNSFESPASEAACDITGGIIEKASSNYSFRSWLKKLSVETGGIQRVTDEERRENSSKVWNACTFW